MNLKGKNILVTGASKRLGKQISISLAKRGANIIIHYNSSSTHAQSLQEKLTEYGVKSWTIQADLSKQTDVENLFQRCVSLAGKISGIVNNASVFPEGWPEEVNFTSFIKTININSLCPFILTRDLSKHSPDEACVVNIIDGRIFEFDFNHFEYDLSKKLLNHITIASALRFAPGVRVNGVAPGPVLPPDGKNDDYLSRISSHVPLKKRGYPEDVASAVVFLFENDYITGQVIFVDGGLHIRRRA